MMLSDTDILQQLGHGIIIDPFDRECLQPASYDVHLDETLLVPPGQPTHHDNWLDWHQNYPPPKYDNVYRDPGADEQTLDEHTLPYRRGTPDTFWLPPSGVALGNTIELLTLTPDAPLTADIAGCSSLGRWWLFVHVTAGFIDPEWSGRLTLELYNASPWWLRLWAGMRIAQLRFYEMSSMSERSYLDTGHYGGATTVLPSQYKG